MRVVTVGSLIFGLQKLSLKVWAEHETDWRLQKFVERWLGKTEIVFRFYHQKCEWKEIY